MVFILIINNDKQQGVAMNIKRFPFILSSLSLAVLLASCGGGGNSVAATTQSTASVTSVVTGTVPGTLIEAFCEDGSYYSVNSTNNGTSKHPFSISIPSNVDCRFVMTTNENDSNNRVVTALSFDVNGTQSGLVTLSGDVDIGYVPLALNTPTLDTNHDGVEDLPLFVSLSSSAVRVRPVSYDPLDSNGDGIPNIYEDDDNDSVSNHYDNDYLPSRSTDDRDGDGVNDVYDRDDDNDGLTDERDDDDDNDGTVDSVDPDHSNSNETTPVTSAPTTPVESYSVASGRLLVSQCAQCHGTNGHSVTEWDSIAGEGNELADEMSDEGGIMRAQAHGYTSTEIQQMAAWLGGESNGSESDNSSGDSNQNDEHEEDHDEDHDED